MVAYSRDAAEPEAESPAAVSVFVGDDFEALEAADDVFVERPAAGDGTVARLVGLAQGVFFAALLRKRGVAVELRHPEVSSVRHTLDTRQDTYFGSLEEPEVMHPAVGKRHAQNRPLREIIYS